MSSYQQEFGKNCRTGYNGLTGWADLLPGGLNTVFRGERGDMKLTAQHVDGMRFLATTEEHSVVVDASRQDGGGGTAMSAPQLFVAAVGACILEFVLNSCHLRGIPVDRLRVEIEYEELPRPRRVGSLEATIHLAPEPAEDVKARLVGVGRHATLVNTLLRPPDVVIRFEGEESL
jgi:uncharacterized OsmC-like protein